MSEDEFAFAEPFRPRPPGPFERAYRRFTAGRFRRAKEAAFFGLPGLATLVAAYELNLHAFLNDPLALLLGSCGVLVIGFGLLPPHERPPPPAPHPKSKRGRR